jgi:hypothetical protein
MLQECPPRFAGPLARASGAEYHRVFTSRNELGFWRAALARQNPDLMASGEGGSNTTLVRVPGKLGGIAERRELEIHAGEPERRSMAFTRTASGICICNLHATNDQPALAVADVLLAAEAATGWAAGAPLIFGGDLNLRPADHPELFARLAADFGLDSPTTGRRAIDHVLVRGLKVIAAPSQWPPEKRELPLDGKALRLSDHAPVEARFARQDPPVLAN